MRVCEGCSDEFTTNYSYQRYCTPGCRDRAKESRRLEKKKPFREPTPCLWCGALLPVRTGQGTRPRKYCNPAHQASYFYYRDVEYTRAKSRRLYALDPVGNSRHNAELQQIRSYGVDNEWKRNQLVGQAGRCACCDEVLQPGRRTVIDHDHTTGQVRSLLCSNCNLMIGNAREKPSNLLAGIRYLTQFQTAA